MEGKLEIDESKLTFLGSMNYIVQVHRSPEGEIIADQYQPRRNKIWTGEFSDEETRQGIEETIERMKIAIKIETCFAIIPVSGLILWST